ncbi:biotin-dependent carboxyltransferase family protein [Rhodobacter sp. CZR27]|uniref:5-oxoprolinase subunit C family protein n=1 Tax=Rhodobacter sp. CZR27 TaxID=2033869 RepID=UPI000BBED581|nr:biotin-dependent carboxyltransferase family protein [Rhodobacter sp. CZR27]
MRARLRVVEVGPLCTVQDAGRPGLMRFGVPQSGPMDREAFALANAALGNPEGAACLEISLGGLVLDCVEGSVSVALAGGGFRAQAAGTLREGGSVFALRAGDRLALRPGDWGSWTVLAVAGRIAAPVWLGSAATHAIAGLGGGLLRPGLDLVVEDAALRPERHGSLPALPRPSGLLRVTLGPQERFFLPGAVEALLGRSFRLSAARDRMGQRLEGDPLPVAALDMPSEPVLRGAVQVAGDGVATVLMADHQTTGGYPKIATVIGPDLDALAQMRAGEAVRFVAVTPAEAVGIARAAHEARMTRLAAAAAPRDLSRLLAEANLIGGVVDARR